MKHLLKAASPVSINSNSNASSYGLPMIEVYGNGILIANGDATPSTADHTDFGSTPALVTVTRTFTIENPGGQTLEGLSVSAPSGFTVTDQPDSSVPPGQSTTFQIRADVAALNIYSGNVIVQSDLGNYSFAVQASAELRDDFTTALAAGSVNNTNAEYLGGSGGGIRKVTDTGNNLSITGGKLVSAGFVAAGNPALGYQNPAAGQFPRQAGLSLEWVKNWTQARGGGGWSNNLTGVAVGFNDNGGTLSTVHTTGGAYAIGVTGVDYALRVTLFATGAAMWRDGKLMWVDNVNTTANVHPVVHSARAAADAGNNDNVRGYVHPTYQTPQALVNAFSTVYQSSPSNGVNFNALADMLSYLDIFALGSPTAGQKIELRFRYQDANNYWTAYLTWTGSQWDFKVDRVVAGTPNNHVNVAAVGTPGGIAVVADANEIWAFTIAAGVATLRGAKITNTTFQTATEVGAWYDIGTMSLLRTFARNGW